MISHISWRGEQNIPYKGMETSLEHTCFKTVRLTVIRNGQIGRYLLAIATIILLQEVNINISSSCTLIHLQLAQEKNNLREEKASLKSDIENLNSQYQQRLMATNSIVMAPAPFPFPMPMPMPPGPFPLHPTSQPYMFFGNQNPRVIANPCSPFVQYIAPNSMTEQQSSRHAPPFVHPSKHDSSFEQSNDTNRNENNPSEVELEESSSSECFYLVV